MSYISVIITDDHPIVLNGLEKMLSQYTHIKILNTCGSARDLYQILETQTPDVLLLDVQMKGEQGDEIAKKITEKHPDISILALTNLDQPFHVRNMFKNGSKGYLLKNATPETLVTAIETVYSGIQYLDQAFKDHQLSDLMNSKSVAESIPKITRREKEVLDLIAEELTSPQIAEKLFITVSAVENHRFNLLFKLNVKNAVGLIKKAIQLGLVKP